MARKGHKGLGPDDRELWSRVARSTTPLDRSRLQKPGAAALLSRPSPPKPAQPASEAIPAFRIGEKSATRQPDHALADRIAHAPVRMDHGTHRRMLRGKLKPEARIDLHGMTLAEAHPALIRFIIDAYDAELRLVLVITGKGRGGTEGDGPIPIRRGVLRHQVPGWLHAPPIGALVLDIREAHQRHGGSGAYYVYLKRRR